MDTPDDRLPAVLASLDGAPESGSVWRHYKGGIMRVITVALVEATLEPCVIYWHADAPCVSWSRPLSQWREMVEVDGKRVPRFEEIKKASDRVVAQPN